MRLTAGQQKIIKSAVAHIVGADSRVWLFGSRADDTWRGGDIDLLVETPRNTWPCRSAMPSRRRLGHGPGRTQDRRRAQGCAHGRGADLRGGKGDGGAAMTSPYLAEHAAAARRALDLAWVESLQEREDLSEKVDAFVGRFGRLQDHIEKRAWPLYAKPSSGDRAWALLPEQVR